MNKKRTSGQSHNTSALLALDARIVFHTTKKFQVSHCNFSENPLVQFFFIIFHKQVLEWEMFLPHFFLVFLMVVNLGFGVTTEQGCFITSCVIVNYK